MGGVGFCLVYLTFNERNIVSWSKWYAGAVQSPIIGDRPGIFYQKNVTQIEEQTIRSGVIHLVLVFPLITSEVWDKLGYKNSSAEVRKRRQQEYVGCLRANLDVPSVAKIHLFSNQPELLKRNLLQVYKLNLNKIEIYNSSLNPTYHEIFKYASDFLQNKLVFILNADNFLGEGFHNVSLDWWKHSGKIMYALTRHRLMSRPSDCQTSAMGYCDRNGRYIGSHDGFMFYMRGKFPESFLSELQFPSHVYGSENVVIWAFQKKLRFHVENPCRRLQVYHNHCTNVRATEENRARVNRGTKSGSAKFSR